MDLNDLRSLVTLAGLCAFVALAIWTWRPARRVGQTQAAELPFLGDASERTTGAGDE